VNMTAIAQAATEPRRLFPTIAEVVRGLACDGALIDGEAVVLRKDGRSDAPNQARRGASLAENLTHEVAGPEQFWLPRLPVRRPASLCASSRR
jgi:hypothetical protein